MSKVIAELLNAKQPLFSIAVKQLEEVSGRTSADIHLQSEISEKFRRSVKRLGLDPKDSTGPEIYEALIEQMAKHDAGLAKKIGISGDPHKAATAIGPVEAAVRKSDLPRRCFAIKHDVARQMLVDSPPKQIMKLLGHSSVESMLKEENLLEVFAALRFAEDEEWLREFNSKYKNLKASDFEDRNIEIVVMPHDRWVEVARPFVEKKRHLSTHLKEMGVVVILPPALETMPGIVTKLLTLTFHYINEVKLYSVFFKLQRFKPNFGEILANTLIADTSKAAVLAGQEVQWRVIQRYFGKLKKEHHPEIFEPHVQPEDLHWRQAEELLYEIDSELDFWRDLDYVGQMYDGRPLSMNFVDVALSYSNDVAYDERYIYHFREALWNEVFARYMGMDVLKEQVLRQLDNDLIAPEKVS